MNGMRSYRIPRDSISKQVSALLFISSSNKQYLDNVVLFQCFMAPLIAFNNKNRVIIFNA